MSYKYLVSVSTDWIDNSWKTVIRIYDACVITREDYQLQCGEYLTDEFPDSFGDAQIVDLTV